MQGGSKEDSDVASCAGLEPRALLSSASEALDSFTRRHAPSQAELFLAAERKLSLEYDAGTGLSTLNQGESLDAMARVALDARQGSLSSPIGDASTLPLLLERAEQLATPNRMGPLPDLPPLSLTAPVGPPSLQPDRAARRMKHFIQSAVPSGCVVQAAVLSQSSAWRAVVRVSDVPRVRTEWREELFVRCETPRGAVVDAVALPPDANEDVFTPLRQRLADAVDALTGPAHPVDRGLPLVLRPAVAAPLAAGLIWLLRGDVAAATPALARAVGRKLFPSVLSVRDDPGHPAGTRRVHLDDEGLPTEALTLVDAGVLRGFLHAADTATRLGAVPNGRGFRPALSPPAPEAVNPCVVPGARPCCPRTTRSSSPAWRPSPPCRVPAPSRWWRAAGRCETAAASTGWRPWSWSSPCWRPSAPSEPWART